MWFRQYNINKNWNLVNPIEFYLKNINTTDILD